MAGVRLKSIVKRRYRDRVVGDGGCLIWCGCHLMTDDFVVQAQLMWSSFLAFYTYVVAICYPLALVES